MGKRKRKRERKEQEKRHAKLLSTLSRFEPESLLALLGAAAASPTCRHRLPSISILIDTVLRSPPTGSERAKPSDLSGLVTEAMEYEPRLMTLEDYVPLDPREKVVTRLGERTYRLFPGARERPVADLIRSKQIAGIIDSSLVGQAGFGLEDLVELVSRYTDHVIAELDPHWSLANITSVDDAVQVTEGEVDAAAALPGIETFVDQCRNPARVRKALQWATSDLSRLRFDPSDGNSSWGAAMALPRTGGLWTFPIPFLADVVAAATSRLAETSLCSDPDLDNAHVSLAENLVMRNLDRWSRLVPHPSITSVGEISAIAFWGEKHVLIVDVVGSLRFDHMSELIPRSVEKLMSIGPGTALYKDGTHLRIPGDCEIIRLVVAAGPAHAMTPTLPGCVTMTLEDFRWIAETADDDADLFYFCREMARQPGIERVFSFETANAWEYWRSNEKALHRTAGGLSMMIVPHQIDSEWEKYVELAPLEELLSAFQLPPLDEWTDVEPKPAEQRADLVDTTKKSGWKVSSEPFPLAIQVVRPDLLTADFYWVPSLGDALQFKITRLSRDAATVRQLASTLADGLLVEFQPTNVDQNEWPVRLLGTSCRTVTLAVDSRAPELEVAQPGILEALAGFLFGTGLVQQGALDEGGLSDFLYLWQQVQKSLSIDAYHVPQRVQDPGTPLKTHLSIRSHAVQQLAVRLKQEGVTPGRLVGRAAVDFENDHVYPALKDMLQEQWASFSLEAILHPAMQELERASAKRERDRQQLFFNVTRMPVVFDPIARSVALQQDASRLTRAITTIAELALREPPAGRDTPDPIHWRTLITISDLMLESALRSEAAHYGVLPVETELSDLFEIKTRHVQSDTGFRAEEMHRGISEHQLARTQAGDLDRSVQPNQGLLAAFPELTDIDAAFTSDFGCSLEVFLRVLATAAGIEVTPDALVARRSPDELANWCSSESGDPKEAIISALGILTLTATDLQAMDFEPWAFRERDARLVTRPFVKDPDSGDLAVMPWWVKQSFDVYERYLRNGRVPWREVGTGALKTALEEYRAKRNRELEDDVGSLLTTDGLPHKLRVKKASVLGLPSLYGEIDAIVAEEKHKILWVLEAKDLGEAFSVAEISRAIRAFFDSDGYLTKLERKLENVRADTDAAVSKVLGRAEKGWDVRGAVVTRRPIPAAFVEPQPYPFVSTHDLIRLIREAL